MLVYSTEDRRKITIDVTKVQSLNEAPGNKVRILFKNGNELTFVCPTNFEDLYKAWESEKDVGRKHGQNN